MKNFSILFLLFLANLVFAQTDLPLNFENAPSSYGLTDFGGNASSIVQDPTDMNNMVVQSIKSGTAELWAGTTMGQNGFTNAIPFSATNYKISIRIWSPDANIPIRLKAEDSNDAGISVETETMTTVAGDWETVEFNFTNQVMGTAQINYVNTYNKLSIFFNFGTDGATAGEKTYYWDDVNFEVGMLTQPTLPLTFSNPTVNYDLTDFGGNSSTFVVDPNDGTNTVVQSIKLVSSQTWAGTTMGNTGFASEIPFADGNTKIKVRIWSPDAEIPIRLKAEDATNPTISVETEAMVTTAGEWQTMEFDFSNQAEGTAAINFNNTYDKLSIFFNFGTDGATAGEKIYYWDDVEFGGLPVELDQVDLPINFENVATIDYALTDFGGNGSSIITDPVDENNSVVQSIKSSSAQTWAGTTMGVDGLASAIPFMMGNTKIKVRIWSPDAEIPIRLKAEDATNPTISVETEAMVITAGEWQTLEFDFSNQAEGTAAINFDNTYDKLSIFFNFGTDGATAGEKIYFWDDVEFGGLQVELEQVDLPITFEAISTVDYALIDFGGNVSAIVVDPTDDSNTVVQSTKQNDAQLWAGTTIGGEGLATTIPFTDGDTKMNVRVWSPDAGIPIRLKAEDATNPTISVETEAMVITAGEWQTLEFDFSNQAEGTAAINFDNTYDKLSIFFNFGTDGATAGEKIYYWDDVEFGGLQVELEQVDLPITFEAISTVDYALIDFGGNVSAIVVDPTDDSNTVVQSTKQNDAQLWAGTTIGGEGLATTIPFTDGDTKMNVRVWSPDAGIPIRLKAEDATNPTISVETEAMVITAGEWQTLEFDFSNQAEGTAAINFDNTYDKLSIFFNFGTDGATAGEKIYYWDDVEFGGLQVELEQVDLPITFEAISTVDYALIDFGGNVSAIVVDPTDDSNTVVQSTKQNDAQLWAGTTIGGEGLATTIPFTDGDTKMNVRVWSPDAGIPIRLKAEDATNPTISVETEAMVITAGEWQTLEFDFSNQAEGTAAINFDNTYDKLSIFFNFGTDGATAGEKIYYWDDVEFGGLQVELEQVDLPITFEAISTVDYALIDFGGNVSAIVVDPTDDSNTVVQSTKQNDAQLWAGTTMGGEGLATEIPFTSDDTKMSIRIWSPDAGIPIRLKAEDTNDGTIAVETESMTTVASEWETIEFNFATQVLGTPGVNLDNTYDKLSIFFNFGTDGATAGEKTYYWDEVLFIGGGGGPDLDQVDLPITYELSETVDYALIDFGGNVSSIVIDPIDGNNTVGQATKTASAQTWAGTTLGGDGLASAIQFTTDETKMNVRIWSPDTGIPIRLKVEDVTDATISVETESMTTVASEWEILEFDFSNEATGTAEININNVYDKLSIFFNFGTDGATAGEKTYYWDDVNFGGIEPDLDQVDLPIDFEDTATVDYDLVDFGGNISAIEEDPTDASNTVGRATKLGDAQPWAGTTMGEDGLASPIGFDEDNTTISVRIWSPDAGTPIRLKVENVEDATISVETEKMTSLAGQWEKLYFNFSENVEGTPVMDLEESYDKISIFFNFGTDGATAGEKTYYWDDVQIENEVRIESINAQNAGIVIFPNPADSNINIDIPMSIAAAYEIIVYDLNGRQLQFDNLIGEKSQIDISKLKNGVYIIQIRSENMIYHQKIVVK